MTMSLGALPDNDIIVPQKRFDSVGFIDTEFTVSTTSGVTEYQVVEGVDNNTGINWSAYTMLLGFGTGAAFTQVGGLGDGLDFDTGPPGGNNTPPSSGAFPIVSRPNEDQLVYSGGVQGLMRATLSVSHRCPGLDRPQRKIHLAAAARRRS